MCGQSCPQWEADRQQGRRAWGRRRRGMGQWELCWTGAARRWRGRHCGYQQARAQGTRERFLLSLARGAPCTGAPVSTASGTIQPGVLEPKPGGLSESSLRLGGVTSVSGPLEPVGTSQSSGCLGRWGLCRRGPGSLLCPLLDGAMSGGGCTGRPVIVQAGKGPFRALCSPPSVPRHGTVLWRLSGHGGLGGE